MSDTIRSMTALQALFADNSSGAISEQDARDHIVSGMTGGFAALYGSSEAQTVTTIAQATWLILPATCWNTPVGVALASFPTAPQGATITAASSKLTLTRQGTWLVCCSVSLGTPSDAEVYLLNLHVSGAASIWGARADFAATTDDMVISWFGMVYRDSTDMDLDIRIKATAGNNRTIVVQDCQLIAARVGE